MWCGCPNGEVEVIDPGTPEEQARAWEKLLEVAPALARLAARQDYDRAVAEARARYTPQPETLADEYSQGFTLPRASVRYYAVREAGEPGCRPSINRQRGTTRRKSGEPWAGNPRLRQLSRPAHSFAVSIPMADLANAAGAEGRTKHTSL